jgi:peptidyl-prolyl cis-trans isomerase C
VTPLSSRRLGRALRTVTGMIVLAGLAAGCSRDSNVLARVRQHAITVAEFSEVARGSVPQTPMAPDSAKGRLLKDLIDRELLVQGALAAHLDQTPEYAAYRERLEAQTLREALYQQLLSGPYPVSDAEVKELYDRRATATRSRLIFAYEQGFARQAANDLARGEDFATVADRYNPTGLVPPGGDTGFIQAGSLLPPLDDLVRLSPPGKIVGPIAAGPEGWFILRVEERKVVPQPPFDEARAQLAEMLRQRKQRAAFSHVFEQLKTEYQVTVVPGAAQFLAAKLRVAPGEGPVAQAPPPPGPEDRARVLARLTGGTYTLGEAYDDMVGGNSGRVDLSVTASVQRWLQSQAVERAAVPEARHRRLDQQPEVQRKLRERLNNFLLDAYYQQQVMARISISPEDYQVAYERYRSSFVRLQKAHLVSVQLADSTAAMTFAQQAGRAPSLREAAATAGLSAQLRDESVTFPAESPIWTQLENHVTMMQPGQMAGPIQLEGGWMVFQLVDKEQDAPPFESLPANSRGQLQGVATEMKREARLLAVTDSLRQAFAPVVVYTDRLQRLPWPPAPLPGTGS